MVNAPEGLNQFFFRKARIYIYRESLEPARERKSGRVSEKFGTFQERERERERGPFRKNSEKIRAYVAICT